MNRLDELYETTKQILGSLDADYDKFDKREEIIAKLNELLEKRATIIKQIAPPYSVEEESIGKKIVTMDSQIKTKMEHLFTTVQADLKQLKQQKESNISYMNPYKNMKTVDGMYLDNKL